MKTPLLLIFKMKSAQISGIFSPYLTDRHTGNRICRRFSRPTYSSGLPPVSTMIISLSESILHQEFAFSRGRIAGLDLCVKGRVLPLVYGGRGCYQKRSILSQFSMYSSRQGVFS